MNTPDQTIALMLPVANHVNNNVELITNIMAYLPLVGNTRFLVQLVKNLPNQGWLYNHLSILGELLAKAHAARLILIYE